VTRGPSPAPRRAPRAAGALAAAMVMAMGAAAPGAAAVTAATVTAATVTAATVTAATVTAVTVVAATGLAGCSGCRKRPPPTAAPVLVEVEVRDLTPPGVRPARLDLQAVRAEAIRIFQEGGVLGVALGRSPAPGQEAWRLQVAVGLDEDAREGKGLARAVVSLELEPVGGPADATRMMAQGGAERPYPLEAADVGAIFTELVKRTLGDVAKGLVARLRLRRADTATLLAALASSDAEVRLAAVTAAAERRERAAVPALIERLGDPAESVRDRALGALVEIGDRRAVAPLTRQTKFRDLEGMRKVIDAIGSLGGEEARSYLELVASGHEDREIRELAREALERMRRKAARGRASALSPR
jgi:hypothetical protein